MRFEKLMVVLVLSVFAGCSCKEASKDLQEPKIKVIEPALAPGTAIVTAEVLNSDEKSFTIKIKKIENRGQGTDNLSKDQEIKLILNKTIEDVKINRGEIYKFKIKVSQVPIQKDDRESFIWRCISITK